MEISLRNKILELTGVPPDEKPDVQPILGDKDVSRTEAGNFASSPYYMKDSRGKEIYMPIEIQVGTGKIPGTDTTYAQALNVTNSQGAYTGRWVLPYTVMSIDYPKKFIDTDLTERQAVVTEFINLQSFRVMVRGKLVNHTANELPELDYTTLVRLYKMRIPVRVNNPMIDILFLDVDGSGPKDEERTVTIRNLHFPEMPGVKHVKQFTLELWRDETFNLSEISS